MHPGQQFCALQHLCKWRFVVMKGQLGLGLMLDELLQGESLWLHLPIIEELAKMCKSVFEGGDVKYAYTTIPTYPRWGRI